MLHFPAGAANSWQEEECANVLYLNVRRPSISRVGVVVARLTCNEKVTRSIRVRGNIFASLSTTIDAHCNIHLALARGRLRRPSINFEMLCWRNSIFGRQKAYFWPRQA